MNRSYAECLGYGDTVDGRNPAPVRLVVYPIFYRGCVIPGGAGLLPSTVRSLILVKTWTIDGWDMGVSNSKGTPKWMVYNGKP